MSDDLFGAPAGWYPDPLGLPQLRWWNNHTWTEQTSAARQPMVVQDTKFAWADDEVTTRRDERLRERGGAERRTEPAVPVAESLRELEPPRAFTQVSQGAPSAPAASTTLPTNPLMPAAAAPLIPAATVPLTPAAAVPLIPAATVPLTPAAAAPSVPSSLYIPDPIVETPVLGHSGPSLDTIFDTRPATAPAEALDALFGEKETRRVGTRVKTPIVTIDHVAATAAAGGSKTANTGPAWVIAMIPVLQLVLSVLLINLLGMSGSQFIYVGILVVPYFAVILLAYIDHKTLVAAGHAHVAHWRWAALTAPVYLLVRALSVVRETGHGIGPILVWFGVAMLHVASIVAVPGVIITLLPSVFTEQIEQSVAADAFAIAGSVMTVECVGNPPVQTRETMVCESVDASDNTFKITVMLVRSNGWIDWQVADWGSFNGK